MLKNKLIEATLLNDKISFIEEKININLVVPTPTLTP